MFGADTALSRSRLDDIAMTASATQNPQHATRRRWLAVLAHAERSALEGHAALLGEHPFEWLRAPEIGLTMVRARIAGHGDRFNLGEATVTRCAVRHQPASGPATAGVGYVLGRDPRRSAWVAQFDALLQVPALHAALIHDVIETLDVSTTRRRAEQWALTTTSRVRFFTMQPEVTG
jgi:alpha-D-ribose 1-methylphosphonate 5-triphosphate synthase subunit PhnG